MTNVMHKFLIYLSIYFFLTYFGLSFSPSSEAGVQLRQWFKSPGYDVSARALTPYPGDCEFLLLKLQVKFNSILNFLENSRLQQKPECSEGGDSQ
jgi:hypothetical protein